MKGSEIKKIREKHGFSQADLAEIIGVKTGTVTKWETGARNIGKSAQKLLEDLKTMEVYDPNKHGKTSPDEARFEDQIADRVFERLYPLLDGNSKKLMQAILNLQFDMDKIKNSQVETQKVVEIIEKRL